jgi:hypothetical protein
MPCNHAADLGDDGTIRDHQLQSLGPEPDRVRSLGGRVDAVEDTTKQPVSQKGVESVATDPGIVGHARRERCVKRQRESRAQERCVSEPA